MLHVLVFASLLAAPVAADTAPAAGVRIAWVDGGLRLDGRFEVAEACAHTAWEVLTDYDHLAQFVPDLQSSRVEHHSGTLLIVEQDAVARALFVTRPVHLLLEVRERPEREIAFRDLSLRDFSSYRGTWSVETTGGQTTVSYELELTPREAVPGFLAKDAARSGATDELQHLSAEINRRCTSIHPR